MEITTYKKAALYINDSITSAGVKSFVFGTGDVSHHDIKGVDAIYKLLIAEFAVIYLKWLGSGRSLLREYRSARFARISEVMNSLYKGQKLDLDVITYTLAEAQKDVLELGETSFFFELIDVTEPCKFGKLYGMIDEWKGNLQTSETMVEVVLAGFVSVARFSRALARTDINLKRQGESVSIELTFDGQPLNVREMLYVDKTGQRYVLVDKGYEREDTLNYYMSIDDFNIATVIKKASRR